MTMARNQTEARIADLPTRAVPAVPEHLWIAAARKVAALKRTTVLFVEHEGQLVGVLDDRALTESADDVTVAAAMMPLRLWLHPAMSLRCARDLFALARASILPVAVGAFLLGAIAREDVECVLAAAGAGPRTRAARTRAAA